MTLALAHVRMVLDVEDQKVGTLHFNKRKRASCTARGCGIMAALQQGGRAERNS